MSPADDALDALARELPVRRPDPARLEQMRTEILAAAGGVTPLRPRMVSPRTVVVAVASALAVAAAVALLWRATGSATDGTAPSRASIVAGHGTEQAQVSGPPDEVVQLRHGTVMVEVAPLGTEERFRVITGDAEVEVRGTRFMVAADRGRIRSVEVFAGVVELRLRAGGVETLAAGQRWDAPVDVQTAVVPVTPIAPVPDAPAAIAEPVAAPPSVAPTPPIAKKRSPATSASPPAAPAPAGDRADATKAKADADAAAVVASRSTPEATKDAPAAPGEAEFRVGWNALKRGEPARAADSFAASRRIANGGAIAEDATYWEGVALARAGRSAPAIRALRGFLTAYPRSARAGEASARLGWLFVDAGDLAGAERWFSAAADDPVPAVRNSARSGLERVKASR